MSNPNLKPSLRAPVVATIPAASQSVGTAVSAAGVDMSLFINAMVVVAVGAFGTDATATLHWEQSTLADFSDAKAIEGRTPVALAENSAAELNLKANELDTNGGFRYVRPVITVGTAAVLAGAVVLGFDAKDQPAEQLAGTVVE
jgi:hypothetical protein